MQKKNLASFNHLQSMTFVSNTCMHARVCVYVWKGKEGGDTANRLYVINCMLQTFIIIFFSGLLFSLLHTCIKQHFKSFLVSDVSHT